MTRKTPLRVLLGIESRRPRGSVRRRQTHGLAIGSPGVQHGPRRSTGRAARPKRARGAAVLGQSGPAERENRPERRCSRGALSGRGKPQSAHRVPRFSGGRLSGVAEARTGCPDSRAGRPRGRGRPEQGDAGRRIEQVCAEAGVASGTRAAPAAAWRKPGGGNEQDERRNHHVPRVHRRRGVRRHGDPGPRHPRRDGAGDRVGDGRRLGRVRLRDRSDRVDGRRRRRGQYAGGRLRGGRRGGVADRRDPVRPGAARRQARSPATSRPSRRKTRRRASRSCRGSSTTTARTWRRRGPSWGGSGRRLGDAAPESRHHCLACIQRDQRQCDASRRR